MPQASTIDPAAKSLRVLCFHGFRTNSKIMADQMQGFRRTLQQAFGGLEIELFYIDGFVEATGLSDPIVESYYAAHKPFYEWWTMPKDYAVIDPKTLQSGIASIADLISQRTSEDTWGETCGRTEETIAYVHEKIQALGTFDMAVGFSQGAPLVTVLTMWYLKYHKRVPWKLNVCISGMRIDGPAIRSVFTGDDGSLLEVPIPSVHFVGKSDPLAHETRKLADMYQTWDQERLLKVVVEHGGGHRFPSLKRDPGVYRPVVRLLQEVCPHLVVRSLDRLALAGRMEAKPGADSTGILSRL